jgi:hypothetical protein
MPPVDLVFAFSHHTGLRLAEIGFLLMLFAGIWLAAARRARTTVAGVALALGALLLIVAVHWGRFN